MALFPYFPHRPFFGDPFFFNELDFFDPWFDFGLFPPSPLSPPTSHSRYYKREDQLSYSSSNTNNNTRSSEQTSSLTSPEKFRIQLTIDGFNPDTIQKRVEGRKLIIEGKHEDRRDAGNFTNRRMRETYDLPENIDPNGITSYVGSNNKLVIEIPYRSAQSDRRLEQTRNTDRSLAPYNECRQLSLNTTGSIDDSPLRPRIIDRGNNQKQLEVSLGVDNYRPEELKVSVRNNELIVEGERQSNDSNRSERSSFYKSTTLPRGTQIDQLQSHYNDGGQLRIEGPVL